ncbi:MAG TPA: VOC family protein [Cyclobacteriaceae bacterium]|nr:VOC family protein [Cyclobacteriaceae bacterium]
MNLPEGYQTVMPYLILRDVAAFIDFAKNVFGATELARYGNEDGSIAHAEIQIGGSTIMMGQSNDDWGVQNAGLYIHVDNTDASFQKAVDEGATVIMPIENKEYGRTCGVKDPQGNTWWITQVLG